MNTHAMNRLVLPAAFLTGLLAIAWVGAGFVGSSAIALAMTAAIGLAYLVGAAEIRRLRRDSAGLAAALDAVPQPLNALGDWLGQVPPALRAAVRQRIEGGRGALPGLTLVPYLIGLLVMLGMLGTFLGMVLTFKGAVFALEGSADLQAIRSALAAPIKGLGLSFGTSVAGVAGSAMLGLMAALARRERLYVTRRLDGAAAGVFLPFSREHRQRQTELALQQQAAALPGLVGQVQALMDQMAQRQTQLDEQLLQRQDRFHAEASRAYTALAQSVQTSLHDSLAASARAAGDSLRPVVESAMAALASESARQHERVGAAVQAQLDGLSARFGTTAGAVAESWQGALQQQRQDSGQLLDGLTRALADFSDRFEQRSGALLDGVQQTLQQQLAGQAQALAQQQTGATEALQTLAGRLLEGWQQAGEQTLAQQQAMGEALAQTVTRLNGHTQEQARLAQDGVARLLAQTEALVQARTESEGAWTRQQGERMDQLAALWRSELAALRDAESARGQAAVARLGELQAALAQQLATLGTALEAPMARLIDTASQAPRAAAELIVQLREEMSRLAERDQVTLQERGELVAHIQQLLQGVHQATGEQRAAIEAMVTSATAVLDQVGRQFTETVGVQASRAEAVAAQVAGSATDIARLGEAFGQGVQQFGQTSEQLTQSLQRVESAVSQSMARSDEQLAYYVAQAREVVDLSISAQQGIVEDLRRLRAAVPKAALAGSGA